MKNFEWVLQLPEDERERLLRVYPDIRRAYDTNGEQGMNELLISRIGQLHKLAADVLKAKHRFQVIKRVIQIINLWFDQYDSSKSIIELIDEHPKRLRSDKDYAHKIKSGHIKPIISDSKHDDKLMPTVSLSKDISSERLVFADGVISFDANLSLLALKNRTPRMIDDLEIEIGKYDSFEPDKAENTLLFIKSLLTFWADNTIGYFPKLAELRAYLLPDKVSTVQDEQIIEAKKDDSSNGLSYRGIAYYLICEGRTITYERQAIEIYDSLSAYSKKSTVPTRGQQLLKEFNTLQERHRFNKTQMKRFVSLINELDEMNILSPEGMEVLNNDREKIGKRL